MVEITVVLTSAREIEQGDVIAQHDDSLAFPGDYDFAMCEWGTVKRIRHWPDWTRMLIKYPGRGRQVPAQGAGSQLVLKRIN